MKVNEKGQEGYFEETINILEKYSGRPKELRWMSGMQFAKRYSNYGALKKFEEETSSQTAWPRWGKRDNNKLQKGAFWELPPVNSERQEID